MDWRIEDIRLFVEVVQTSSFTEAARRLSVPRPSVSRRIAALERAAGVRLLWRTTRRVQPTDIGAEFFAECQRALKSIGAAERVLANASELPRGHLRISAPPRLGPAVLQDTVARYMSEFPEVTVDIQFTDEVVDLRAEGFDLGLRIGPVVDELLVASKVGVLERILCASPEYLERYGAPKAPSELLEHDVLMFARCPDASVMKLKRGEETVETELKVRLCSNDFDLLYQSAVRGHGVAMLTEDVARDAIESGALRRVLSEWSLSKTDVNIVYLGGPLLSRKVSAFLKMLRQT